MAWARVKSICALAQFGRPNLRPLRSLADLMPLSGLVRISCTSSAQDRPITRVSRPLARAQMAGMLPPWRTEFCRVWSKCDSRTAWLSDSRSDLMAVPWAPRVSSSQPFCTAMPRPVGTGQRVYQSVSSG
ncbi:hypothetical protein D9M69_399030 [compost metagenome]